MNVMIDVLSMISLRIFSNDAMYMQVSEVISATYPDSHAKPIPRVIKQVQRSLEVDA